MFYILTHYLFRTTVVCFCMYRTSSCWGRNYFGCIRVFKKIKYRTVVLMFFKTSSVFPSKRETIIENIYLISLSEHFSRKTITSQLLDVSLRQENRQHATCTGDITLRGREKISHLLEANIVIIGQLTNFFSLQMFPWINVMVQ